MLEELSERRKEIINYEGKNILKACPGGGKTYLLANKIIQDLKEWNSTNSGMAILSFTNIAKNELISKIYKLSGIRNISYPHYLGTLDSFISQYILLPYGYLVMPENNRPSILDSSFGNNLLDKWKKAECHSNHCVIENFLIDNNSKVYNTLDNFENCHVRSSSRPCENVKKILYNKGYLTYSESVLFAIKILEDFPEIANLIGKKFPYFLIDESQDTSKEQMKLLEIIFNLGYAKTIFLIGDSDQSIYEWRRADPAVFNNIYHDFNWNAIQLNENHRSSQLICNATYSFSTLSEISTACGDSKDFNLKPRIVKYDDKDNLKKKFLESCKNCDIDINPENIAILFRGRASINNKYMVIDNLWQNKITTLLARATYEKSKYNLNEAFLLVSKVVYLIIFNDNGNSIDYELIKTKYDLSAWRHLVIELIVELPKSDISMRLWSSEMSKILKNYMQKNNIEQKEEFNIKTKSRVSSNGRFASEADFKEQPVKVFFENAKNTEYTLSTIHGVKGCTFEAILLIINSRGRDFTANKINDCLIDSEINRMLYVALTRPKKILVIAFPTTVPNNRLQKFSKENWNFTNY